MGDGPAQMTDRLGERYALYGEIASGGMATVHFGRLVGPVGFSRTVAIKRLHTQYAAEPEFVKMFVDEALLAARVRHPNVVATMDVVATEGQLYLVMDYVQGESLRRLWKSVQLRGGRIPRRIAASIIIGVLHGLHAAHEAKDEKGQPLGIVHRDVSPQNILVGTDGIARVIDFGIAKAAVRLQTTGAGQLKGKPAYMAPEQILDKPVTRQTDIYAAAVILWEMLTGSRLFWAKSDAEIITNVLRRPVDRPSSKVPSLLPALDDIVLKGLERDPSRRWATARDLAKAIEDCIAPASASDVGEWVERIGGEVLQQRERRLKEIENGTAQPMAFPVAPPMQREPQPSEPSSTPLGQALPTMPMVQPIPDLALPTRAEIPLAKTRDAVGGGSPELTPSSQVPMPMAAAHGDIEFDSFGDAPTLEGEVKTLEIDAPRVYRPPTASELPTREIPPSEPPLAAAKRSGWGWVVALSLLALLVGAGVWYAPLYVLQRCIQAAARQGVSLSVQHVTLRPHAILLTGVKATAPAVPALSAAASEVEVALSGVHAQGVTARNIELTLSGTLDELSEALRNWRAQQPGEPLSLQAQSGHVTWSNPFGDGTQLEAWDASVDLALHASSRDEVHFFAPSTIVRVPRGNLGPWRVRLDRDVKASHLEVAFDPATPDWAVARVSEPVDGPMTIDLNIPASPVQRVGAPPDLFAPLADPGLQIEAAVSIAPGSSERLEGKASIVLLGVKAGKARATTGLRFDAALTQAPDAMYAVAGTLVVGASKGKISGSLSGTDGSFRTALTWRPSTVSCPEAPSAVIRPKAPPPLPPSPVTLELDTTDLGSAGVKTPPAGCALGVFAAP